MARNPSHELNVQLKAASFTVLTSDDIFIVSANATATLPLAAAVAAGKSYLFAVTGSTTLAFAASGSDTITVAGLAVVNAAGEVAELMSDGINRWLTIRGLIA